MAKQTTQPPLIAEFGLRPSVTKKVLIETLFPNHPSEKQVAKYFEVLGRAISVWQLVETALYEVYERALGPLRPGACGASFHALQTFNRKLDATHSAVAFCFLDDKKAFEDWKKLRKRADEKSTRRNQFAHFATYIMFDKKPVNEKVRLEPHLYDWRYVGDRPTLGMAEIAQITEQFVKLANELRRFQFRIPVASK